MFIKRDYRKVDQILADDTNDKKILKFSNRKSEFQSNIKCLCRESYVHSAFANLVTLNLYGNDISNIDGIGIFKDTNIKEINLGSNKLSQIPLEFGALSTLTNIYLDDNEIESFPIALNQLKSLRELRLSGNSMSYVPPSISSLQQLRILSLDNNELTEFPTGILELTSLTQLWLRQNKIKVLPANIDVLKFLKVISLSSNSLDCLPECITNMTSLEKIYANSNLIHSIHPGIVKMANLQILNLSNNKISMIPDDCGTYDSSSGILSTKRNTDSDLNSGQSTSVVVTLLGNPISLTQ